MGSTSSRSTATGQLTGTLPDGVAADDLDLTALRRGQTISGANGSLVYAAAPQQRPRSTVVAVVTGEATSTVGGTRFRGSCWRAV